MASAASQISRSNVRRKHYASPIPFHPTGRHTSRAKRGNPYTTRRAIGDDADGTAEEHPRLFMLMRGDLFATHDARDQRAREAAHSILRPATGLVRINTVSNPHLVARRQSSASVEACEIASDP